MAHCVLSSDASALIEHTKTVLYMEDGDVVHFKDGRFAVYNLKEGVQDSNRQLQTLQMELDAINRGKTC